ncbi:hypothetical protein I553_3234 [Mycobacterium xenopi 4042]|uniref:Uncharacterized protein n=1 Tax=Mycobacterium xenopi 4042 TaxID=1299334 RepID=X8E390_MYCXE|nr:hypothetical protein I552_0920 [Mycobacterium xenopi 3993]EUA75342.1 hypothetical protein I553_3234 [Mycobacterium xenopi 4042]
MTLQCDEALRLTSCCQPRIWLFSAAEARPKSAGAKEHAA